MAAAGLPLCSEHQHESGCFHLEEEERGAQPASVYPVAPSSAPLIFPQIQRTKRRKGNPAAAQGEIKEPV